MKILIESEGIYDIVFKSDDIVYVLLNPFKEIVFFLLFFFYIPDPANTTLLLLPAVCLDTVLFYAYVCYCSIVDFS